MVSTMAACSQAPCVAPSRPRNWLVMAISKCLTRLRNGITGRAEGRTRQEVSEAGGFQWDVWRDGPRSLPESLEGDWVETLPSGEQVPVHNGPGETVEEAAARTRDAIDAVMPLLNAGHDVLLVAHAHVLRILTSQWLDVDPHFARLRASTPRIIAC